MWEEYPIRSFRSRLNPDSNGIYMVDLVAFNLRDEKWVIGE